jgi:hypothetical protein
MMRRARWLATGVALGAGGTIWAKRRLGALQGRLEPGRVAGDFADATRDRVRAAVGVGRERAQRRESEIRAGLENRRDPTRREGAGSRRVEHGAKAPSTGMEMTAR